MNPMPPDNRLTELLRIAQNAAKLAYCPYSKFSVGCALSSKSGKVFSGCNIENASYPVTICAERVAAAHAVVQNDLDWDCLVVVSPEQVSMCGMCRQFLFEFCPELQVWCGYLEGDNLVGPHTLEQLLPSGMTLTRIRPQVN